MAGHGGGAWKVAYADFVTAMMAFFMVMWITAQSKPVKQAVAQYFKDPAGFKASMIPINDVDDGSADKMPEGLTPPGMGLSVQGSKASGKKGGELPQLGLSVLHDGDRRILGTVVVFPENSAELTPEGRKQLERLVPLVRGKRNKLEVRGHATRRPLPPGSTFKDPWQLCYARCQTTMKYLADQGVEVERLRLSQAGPYEPQTIDEDVAKQAQNSRVEIYVLGEFVDDYVGTREERAKRFATPIATPAKDQDSPK
jgi:chemotaxis protein MotB